MQTERKKNNLRKRLSSAHANLENMPKYQALFRIKVDMEASYDSLRRAELKPVLMGGRPTSGGLAGEAQIKVNFRNRVVSALISKSLVQISSPSQKEIYSVVDVFQKRLVFEPGQPSLLASLSSINEPQKILQDLKKQLAASILRNIELEDRLQKLTDIVLTLFEGLSSLDVNTRKKISPSVKKALDDYCRMSTSGQ